MDKNVPVVSYEPLFLIRFTLSSTVEQFQHRMTIRPVLKVSSSFLVRFLALRSNLSGSKGSYTLLQA